jgi:hypothetical protein
MRTHTQQNNPVSGKNNTCLSPNKRFGRYFFVPVYRSCHPIHRCHPALDAGSPEKRTAFNQGITGQARNDKVEERGQTRNDRVEKMARSEKSEKQTASALPLPMC